MLFYQHKKKKSPPGFTIIELLISAGIIAVISLMAMANFRGTGQKMALENEAERLSGIIREAQMNSLVGLTVGGVRPAGGFGIHLAECGLQQDACLEEGTPYCGEGGHFETQCVGGTIVRVCPPPGHVEQQCLYPGHIEQECPDPPGHIEQQCPDPPGHIEQQCPEPMDQTCCVETCNSDWVNETCNGTWGSYVCSGTRKSANYYSCNTSHYGACSGFSIADYESAVPGYQDCCCGSTWSRTCNGTIEYTCDYGEYASGTCCYDTCHDYWLNTTCNGTWGDYVCDGDLRNVYSSYCNGAGVCEDFGNYNYYLPWGEPRCCCDGYWSRPCNGTIEYTCSQGSYTEQCPTALVDVCVDADWIDVCVDADWIDVCVDAELTDVCVGAEWQEICDGGDWQEVCVDGALVTPCAVYGEEDLGDCSYVLFADNGDRIYNSASDTILENLNLLEDSVYVDGIIPTSTDVDIVFSPPQGEVYVNGAEIDSNIAIRLGFEREGYKRDLIIDSQTGRISTE